MKLVMNFVKRTDMKVVYAAGIATGVGLTKLADKVARRNQPFDKVVVEQV